MRNWHDGVFFGLHFDIHANAADQHLGRDVTVDHLLEQFQKIRPDLLVRAMRAAVGRTARAGKPALLGLRHSGGSQVCLR